MEFHLMLLLIVSVMLSILSAWNLSTFHRLKEASKNYKNDQNFEDSCHVSKTYTSGGEIIAIVMLLMSFLILGVSCVTIFGKNK